MNYRHAFHAGNFADVLKHAVLGRVLDYLRQKQAAFRVIDTHAGAGLYDLAGAEAQRSGEWRDGIGRLMAAPLPERARALLAPYLDVVGALNKPGRLKLYPGSPAIARAWLRSQDRLVACELADKPAVSLKHNMRGDPRIKTIEIDGWTAMSAYVPPPERRGLVLVDPPFEEDGDFHRLSHGLAEAHRKWATGIYMLWYPIKDRGAPDALAKRVGKLGIPKVLRIELIVSSLRDASRLNGCGLILVNPPWTLENELRELLPALTGILQRDNNGAFKLDWLSGEAHPARS